MTNKVRIFAAKKDGVTERYERHIADLEDQITALKNSNEDLRNKKNIEVAKAVGQKEQFLAGLSHFLTSVYSELGQVQNKILKQSIAVNEHIATHADTKMAAYAKELTSLANLNQQALGLDGNEEEDD